ncbi:hypothetical protein C8R47DRAFT_70948 [Mycena vitilis]|nr:hypothetical protein C8R47DRAFT_70948 [Mycena vitilis]
MNAPTPSLVAPNSPSQVQESRTKRLVRQQARFRDRGGIFVPRTHNNLLDILLGKKKPSPLKGRSRSRSRSISVSPTKRLSRDPSVGRKSGGTATKKAKKPVCRRFRGRAGPTDCRSIPTAECEKSAHQSYNFPKGEESSHCWYVH